MSSVPLQEVLKADEGGVGELGVANSLWFVLGVSAAPRWRCQKAGACKVLSEKRSPLDREVDASSAADREGNGLPQQRVEKSQ